MEYLYSRREAAEILGISVSALDEVRSAGAIAFIQYKPNGKVLISERALKDYIDRSTHAAIPPTVFRQTYRKIRQNGVHIRT